MSGAVERSGCRGSERKELSWILASWAKEQARLSEHNPEALCRPCSGREVGLGDLQWSPPALPALQKSPAAAAAPFPSLLSFLEIVPLAGCVGAAALTLPSTCSVGSGLYSRLFAVSWGIFLY